MKLAAQTLNELPQAGRDFTVVQVLFVREAMMRLPDVSIEDLKHAWLTLLQRAAVNRHHRITREQLSVREHITRILRLLQTEEFVEFDRLFTPEEGVPVLVVSFLAVLELAKETLIEVSQEQAYAPIYVKPRGSAIAAVK